MFYETMLAAGIPIAQAKLMYFAVYRFGPRWAEEPVDCYFACAEPGEVSLEIQPSFNQADYDDGKSLASRSDISLEELEEIADKQLSRPNSIVSVKFSGLTVSGTVQRESRQNITIRDLRTSKNGAGYLVEDKLLNGKEFDRNLNTLESYGPRR